LALEVLEDRTVPSPVLIQDINTHNQGSDPQDYVTIGNVTYFTAVDGFNGTQIWKTDGTMLSVAVPSSVAAQPANLTNVNGTLFFSASDATHGNELWKSDGTNTSLVADMNPGPYSSNPSYLTNVNGTLFFAANNVLWKSDGTTTTVVPNINTGNPVSNPTDLTNVNGTLFFAANGALWKSNGANASNLTGTWLTYTSQLTNLNGTLLFTASDGVHGAQLFESDGHATGEVTFIGPPGAGSSPYDLTVVNSTLYFGASDSAYSTELWKTNGSTYSQVASITPGNFYPHTQTLNVNGTLFLSATDGIHGYELWKTDGTTTTLVADINPGYANSYPAYLTNVNGTVYFAADDGVHGNELWKSDGNTATLVADIFPGLTNGYPSSSNPNNFVNINGALFFAADDGIHGNELWTSNGTAAGTRLFQDIDLAGVGSNPGPMTNVNGTVFFSADDGIHGDELWATDGNTCTLFDLNPGQDASNPNLFMAFGGQLYFIAFDDVNGSQLWRSDGASASMINFEPGISASPSWLTVCNGLLYFSANDSNYNSQLWRTDGTTTTMISINPSGASYPQDLMNINGTLYFFATDGVHGYHLWTTTGTSATMLPYGFNNVGVVSNGNNSPFVWVNGWFYFVGNDGISGTELWRTDGTTASLVADINPGPNGSNPTYLTAANGQVFFVADDGTHGQELWQSDGTTTTLAADINPGPGSSQPIFLTNVNGTLFFEAYDPTDGSRLWKATGSSVTLVGNYNPSALTAINGLLYFEAYSSQGNSLYSTDGTTTNLVSDLDHLVVQGTFLDVNNTLFFDGDDAAYGFEPRKLPLNSVPQFVLSVTPIRGVSGSISSVTVTVEDANGNLETGYRGTIHFTSSDSQAGLPVDYTFTAADAGVHTFNVTLQTAGAQSITATDTAMPALTGTKSDILVAPADFLVAGFPSSTAGVAQTFTVTAMNANGSVASGYRGTVHFTSTDSQAVLPVDYSFTGADSGAHTFSAVLKTAGSQALIATDTFVAGVTGTQPNITVSPAAVSQLAVTGFPSPTVAGVTQTFTLTVEDGYGNTVSSYRGTVAFVSSDFQAGLPPTYTFTSTDNGVHVFNATLKTADLQSLTATDTTTSTITGTQSSISVNPAAATILAITGFPSSTPSGAAQSFTVTAKDPYNNTASGYTGIVSFACSDAQAIFPEGYIFRAADAGSHTFTATLETEGNQSLTATDIATRTITGSVGVLVTPAASQFAVYAPFDPTAGGQISITVVAEDSFGNIVRNYTGTVHFTSSDPQAVLPADATLTEGIGTFAGILKTSGSQSITATDTVFSTLSGHGLSQVRPALASSFNVNAPTSTTAGSSFSVTVTALDPYSNIATSYTGTIHFTSSDPQAALPPDYTFTASDAGVHTFTATLKTAGNQSLTATDTTLGSLTGNQSNIAVSPAAVSRLAVTGFPTPTVAGTAQTFTVTAQDAYANLVASYRGTVRLSSSDGQASLPASYTFTSTDNGVHVFTATLKTAGLQSLTATDTTTPAIAGTEAGITVMPAAAKILAVTGFPSPTTAGAAHNITVTVKDAYGNVASGYTGTVHFTSTDSRAVLPSNYAFTATDAGVHTFAVTFKTAGTQSITAKDTVTSTIAGTEGGIAVTPAGVSQLRITAPSSATAGVAFSITVTAQDAYGNTVASYTGTVHFSSTDTRAMLPPDYTFVVGDAGKHTFASAVILKTSNKQTITATDKGTASITGSAIVNVSAAAASSLSITGPATASAGTPFTFAVTALDVYGNRATSYRGTVHFTSSDPRAMLPVDYTFTAANNGSHSFTSGATLKTAGTQAIIGTDTLASTIAGQLNVTVNPAAASVLVVSGFPNPIIRGTAGSFTVTALDAYGNIATGYPGILHFTSSDTAANLPANYTFTAADAGTHTFTATLNTTGVQSITATDTAHSTITVIESGIQVNAPMIASSFPSAISDDSASHRFANRDQLDWFWANISAEMILR
jgi:ELWxxDGT repeat protein